MKGLLIGTYSIVLNINKTETAIEYQNEWYEILADQTGQPYFMVKYNPPLALYFTPVPDDYQFGQQPKVLIHMIDGVVNKIVANIPELTVAIIDEDDNGGGDWEYVSTFDNPDEIAGNFAELYKEFTPKNNADIENAMRQYTRVQIYNGLKEANL